MVKSKSRVRRSLYFLRPFTEVLEPAGCLTNNNILKHIDHLHFNEFLKTDFEESLFARKKTEMRDDTHTTMVNDIRLSIG